MSLNSKKKPGPPKLQTKQSDPASDDIKKTAAPAAPSPKSIKKSAGASEQRRHISPPKDDVSEASGSAAPLGRAASERTDKVRSQPGQAKDIARKGEKTAQKGEKTARKGEDTARKGENIARKGETAQKGENIAQKGENIAQKGENTAQKGENAQPSTVSPGLSKLKGLQVTEGGQIRDQNGNPMGKVVEGDSKELAGQTVGDNGEIFDEDGDVVGRVDVLDEAADQPMELPGEEESKLDQAKDVVTSLGELEGLPVSEDGMIKTPSGQVVGKIVEGDPEELVGYTVNGEGEIVDDEGDAIGRAELIPAEEQSKLDEAKDVVTSLGELDGLPVSEGGMIKTPSGQVVGKIVEGDPEDLVGYTVNAEGEIVDDEGDAIGRAELIPAEEQSKLDEAKDVVTSLGELEGLPVSEDGMIKTPSGQVVGKIVEGDPEELVGYTVNGEGEIVDDEGDAIGRAELIPAEEQSKLDQAQEVVTTLEELEGLPVSEDGMIKKSSGQVVGKIVEGDPEDLVGYTVNAEGEIVDDEGDAIGRAELIPVEEQQKNLEETAHDATEEDNKKIPSIESLEGLKCNKRGYIMDEATGKPVGELIEGDPKKLSKLGAELDAKGQFWDNRGNVIGKAQPIPVYDEEEGGPFAGLDGLVVVEDGWVEDENQTRVGQLIEGDAKKLVNRAVDEDGEILDQYGNIIGRAERWEEPEAPEVEPTDLSSMEGLSCNKAGYVIGSEGFPIGRVIEGDPKKLAGKKIFENGEIYEGKDIVGRVELIPEDERERVPDGLFAGFESLVVNKDGFVEDENGSIVGQLIEGDAKKLRGHAVDEDGEIADKYGNVKGRCEPYEPPEEEPPAEEDLSILKDKVVNKQGNIVDPATGAIFGRLIEGDKKRLAGRKVDDQGQIWNDNGKVVGRAGLIPDAEQEEKEGQFYGFENAEVGKDGVVVDEGRIIGRLIEGDAKALFGRKVDEDGDVIDKNGNTIGKAERWEPEEKQRDINPMSGRKITKEGEVRDADGNLIGKLTSGNLATLVGKTVDDGGYVVDNDGNKIGECTLLENIQESEPEEEGLTEEELEAQAKAEEDRKVAEKMINILNQTLDRIKPVCQQITEQIEKADHTPKDELDEEKLVQTVKPLLEEGGRILQECNGSIRALDPDGRIAATAKARASSHDATPEEYQLAGLIKELAETVTKTIENGRKRIADMPHASKKLNPLWALLSEPLFQIIAAVGLLLSGVLGLVGKLLGGLGLGGLLDGLLGGLGLDKLFDSLGLGGGKSK